MAFVWGFEGLACMLIRRMTGLRYNLLPFCKSLVSVETLHDVSEEQASFITSMYSIMQERSCISPNFNFQKA